jgi:hypothetical protein
LAFFAAHYRVGLVAFGFHPIHIAKPKELTVRSILLDEFSDEDMPLVADYLAHKAEASGVEGLYWIALPRDLWNETQKRAHVDEQEKAEARSFRFAVELGRDWVRFEMLVRSEGLRNLGGGWADKGQTLFLLGWADEMLKTLHARRYQ